MFAHTNVQGQQTNAHTCGVHTYEHTDTKHTHHNTDTIHTVTYSTDTFTDSQCVTHTVHYHILYRYKSHYTYQYNLHQCETSCCHSQHRISMFPVDSARYTVKRRSLSVCLAQEQTEKCQMALLNVSNMP